MIKYKSVEVEAHPDAKWYGIPGDGGWVYAIRFGDKVKIGCTRKSPHNRAHSLQTQQKAAFDDIHIIVCDHARRAERGLHMMFSDYRLYGEWFNLSEAQMDEIKAIKEYKNDQYK